MDRQTIEGAAAQALGRKEKWALLAPHLQLHGREALAYATLQQGMEYFIDPLGYIAFLSIKHPVFAPRGLRIVLSDPVCAEKDYAPLITRFLAQHRRAAFVVVSEPCAEALRGLGFKVNCVGYMSELPIQTYNTKGNWKELDLIKRARNEAHREGITIREEEKIEKVDPEQLQAVTDKWIQSKPISDREIWVYARRPVLEHEPDVRKFVAYDREGRVAGYAFYDPMYREGRVYGYSANISRCDEQRFTRLATAIHMAAIEKFKPEGREVFSLLLAPFVKLELGKFNDDFTTKMFFNLSARYGNNIYNFLGLSFNKSKYRGLEKPSYFASNSLFPSNDVYLAFLSSDITQSYFSTVGRLLWGMLTAMKK